MNTIRKVIIGAVLFVSTLGIGYFFGLYLNRGPVQIDSPPATTQSNVTSASIETTSTKIDSSGFVPEFRDLPNVDEIEWPESNRDLIDTFQIGGIYRESDVIAKTGETWLTLFENNGKYSFENARANVRRLKTISYVGDEFDVQLTFDKPGVPILAVRNIKTLRPGKVKILYNRPSSEEIDRRNLPIGAMEDGYKQDFNLNESWYTLRVSKGVAKDGMQLGLLVLEHNNEKQVIYSTQYFPGEKIIIGDLFFVGDLDNDGKLDIYFDAYNEKGGRGGSLFISSEAAPDKLVKLVATFSVPGC